MLCHHQRFDDKLPTGLDILGKLSHQMPSASILGNLYFQVTDEMQVQSGFSAFLMVSHESQSLFFGVWWHKAWLVVLDRAFPGMLKRVLLEMSFPIDKISKLQGMMLKVFISHTVKRLLYPIVVVYNRSY